jgi:rare lipoprotein A
MRVFLAALTLCLALPARAEIASCYGREHGQTRTATGANYDPSGLTAAHRTLPFGTLVLVTDARSGRAVTVTINDRGPAAWTHRAIDLSLGACRAIGSNGLARVSLQIIGEVHAIRSSHRNRHHGRHHRLHHRLRR